MPQEYCGDDIVQAGEECDDGNQNDADSCSNECTFNGSLDLTFTTCGATGPTGPNDASCASEYTDPNQTGDALSVINGIQHWEVPVSGTYRIEAYGAKGGNGGGDGARIRGDFNLAAGQALKILVGQQGLKAPQEVGSGGGGGSFVATITDEPLIIAAGGAGTGHTGAYSNASPSLGPAGFHIKPADCPANPPSYCCKNPVGSWWGYGKSETPGLFHPLADIQIAFHEITDGLSSTFMLCETRVELLTHRGIFNLFGQGVPTGLRINSSSINEADDGLRPRC